jgi:methanethiol S-methyltransferase
MPSQKATARRNSGGKSVKRWSFFVFGVVSHALFFAVFLYMAGFVANLSVPKTIDSPASQSFGSAILIDLGLVALFALQHSVMARPAFKQVWTRFVPEPIERSTYVLISCVVTVVLMWQWRGIDTVVWDLQQPIARGILWGLFAVGWLLVPAASLMISHFDLFGTRQVWLHLKGRPYESLPFRTPMLYSRVRHPLYIGWALAFWATPTMTLGHWMFAAAMTLYMGAAAIIEERDLEHHFGALYREYQQRVPMFVPRLGSQSQSLVENRT